MGLDAFLRSIEAERTHDLEVKVKTPKKELIKVTMLLTKRLTWRPHLRHFSSFNKSLGVVQIRI